MTHVLFVCAGNICRSPLAEAFARREFARRSLAVEVAGSAGLIASEGEAPCASTIEAGRRAGVDVSRHRARRFDTSMIEDGIWILVMENFQRFEVMSMRGAERSFVHLLGDFGPDRGEIADPENGDGQVFDACVDAIGSSVAGLADRLGRQGCLSSSDTPEAFGLPSRS